MAITDYFRTTEKGIYLMQNLPSNSSLSRPYFIMSLALEIIILLFFIGIFALSIFRSVKKIKNSKFKSLID